MTNTHLAILISKADPQFDNLSNDMRIEYLNNLAFHLDCIEIDYDLGCLRVTDLMDAINGESPPFTNSRAMAIYGWLSGWHHRSNS